MWSDDKFCIWFKIRIYICFRLYIARTNWWIFDTVIEVWITPTTVFVHSDNDLRINWNQRRARICYYLFCFATVRNWYHVACWTNRCLSVLLWGIHSWVSYCNCYEWLNCGETGLINAEYTYNKKQIVGHQTVPRPQNRMIAFCWRTWKGGSAVIFLETTFGSCFKMGTNKFAPLPGWKSSETGCALPFK